MATERPPRRPGPYRSRSAHLQALYDKWAIPLSEEPDAPLVTSLHDGLDWVQVHAPRSFFEDLAAQLEAGETADLEKWLLVWSMARKEPDPDKCGAPTKLGGPCHFDRPCKHHPRYRRPQ